MEILCRLIRPAQHAVALWLGKTPQQSTAVVVVVVVVVGLIEPHITLTPLTNQSECLTDYLRKIDY